jgi:hypothetical protein
MKNEQLLHQVYKLKVSLNEKKRKEVQVRRAIKLMRGKNAALVRENTLHVKEYADYEAVVRSNKELLNQLNDKNLYIKSLQERKAALVRENTLYVKEYADYEAVVRSNKELLNQLNDKNLYIKSLQERKAALVEENAALVAAVSGERDAALAALNRLRVLAPLDESQLHAVRAELKASIERTQVAEIRCKAEQAVASKNPNFCCRTSYDLMRDPVSDENGMTHERVDIEQWFAKQAKEEKSLSCPYGNPLVSTKLIPNIFAKNSISKAVGDEVARLSKPAPRRHPLG